MDILLIVKFQGVHAPPTPSTGIIQKENAVVQAFIIVLTATLIDVLYSVLLLILVRLRHHL
jgi:hypothetical protein